MTEEDKKQLIEKLKIITDGCSGEKYIIYRTVKIVEHAIKEADERGYVAGWNAALLTGPGPMKPIKKSYGFKDV